MANKTISLDQETIDIFRGMKEADKNFTLSGFVQEQAKQNISYLSPKEIQQKIKMHEITIEDARMKIEHLNKVLPVAEERKELLKDSLQPRSNAINILKQQIKLRKQDHEIVQYAKVWEKMTGVDYKELIKEAKNGK